MAELATNLQRAGTPFDWEDLLLQIEDKRVIPLVGADLLQVQTENGIVPFNQLVAGELARQLGISADELPADARLHQVAFHYVARHGKPQRVYSRVKAIVDELQVPTPEPLKQLASITDFSLFLSTTFDDLLARAIDEVRFGGQPRTQRLAYSLHLRNQDLSGAADALALPAVYQLFGRLTSSPDYAVTEEDVLEFVHSLQSEEKRPQNLFDALRNNHMLVIGCSYADWLSRFFMRTVRNERLLIRGMSRVVADDRTAGDSNLVVFLQLCATDVFLDGGAVQFVQELHKRWHARNDQSSAANPTAAIPADPLPAMEPDAIFLSYASEDRQAVLRMKSKLDEAGLDVWFDQAALRSGDDWDQKIRRNINSCSLFLPFVSKNSTTRFEGYFRKEWRWAIDRAQGMDERFPFIHPIFIDDTPPTSDAIPGFLHQRHAQRFPGGEPSDEFIQRLKQLVREVRVRKAGLK